MSDIVKYRIDGESAESLVHVLAGGYASDDNYRVVWFDVTGPALDETTIDAFLATWQTDNAAAIDAAIETGEIAEPREDAAGQQAGAKQWFVDNPNAKLLYTLSIPDLEAQIDALDFSALPAGTAAKLKLLLKTLSVSERVFARRLGLI